MYHCQLQFYFLGQSCRMFEIIKEMSPLEHFAHEYMESEKLQETLAAKADVILADFKNQNAKETLQSLCLAKKKEAELIVLITQEQRDLFRNDFEDVKDVWICPMSEEEVRFRFLRWQQGYKMSKDFWQTKHYFETTINGVPNLVWYKDKNGIHKKVNNSFCRTVNKTRQQVEGRGHAYIWDVEHDDPACIESEREVMETGKTCVSEEIIQTGTGERILMTYKSPLYDLNGSVMGTAGVAIDVTQEREYEQEIMRKNQTLEKIFTTIDCGVIRHSIDGTSVFSINQAALNILGYESKEEMVEDGFVMVAKTVVEEDKPKLQRCMESLEKEGDIVSTEYRVQHKDGKILHIMGNAKLLKEDGQLFYQRFLLDCTAQKLEEKENERRHTELVQALGIDYSLICYLDLDENTGIPLRNNKEGGQVFLPVADGKFLYDKSIGRYIQEHVHEEDREMLTEFSSGENLKREMAERKVSYKNYRILLEGDMKYFQLKVVRIGDWKKQHCVVLGFRSVDEETRREMEKTDLLRNALMQANQANKAKSTFLSNMSHDIRTPMNAIVGFTTLAITHIDYRDQVEQYLKKIMTSGNHLLSLINDVLDMSRIESGKIHLDENPCRLPDILHGLRNILQADIHAKQLELYIDAVDIMDEEIYCDKLRLNQVLLNLLSNSVKYTGPGGIVSIRVTEKPGAPNGYANYEFNIKDTGIGMSEEFVSRIFEPFEREKSSTNSGIQGTGLGMAITKNIVDMMNGTIDVKSEQGVGTEISLCFTFRVYVGMKEPQDIPQLKNCRALVVDDDFNTCDSVTYMLGQIGLRAEWTLSGKEALLRTHQAVMRNDIYTVYVIDWMLPDMNGIEVTRKIRKEMGEDVPIILLTAYDWLDIEEEAKEAGITAFCSKPLFLSELRRCLHSIVGEEEEQQKHEEEDSEKNYTGCILLAEDNELNQEIARVILGDAGFTVEVAANGRIAVDMLKQSEPGYYQLILMDVRMPEMTGYEATRAIRKLENKELASIPIFAMTANAFEEDKQEAMKAGMNGHLAKPIDVKALFSTLDKILM
ncbi:PAS domain S-box protein [Lachnospiraceae bacterium 3-1]|nr:PAS domain S-box protein [Lachnospiraceae bacterium 3-1]